MLVKLAFLCLAGIFFVMGVLGALLPGLPATPFLLLCSFFLLRSSPRLNAALLRTRLVGPLLVDWQVHGGVRPHVKMKAVVLIGLVVSATLWSLGELRAPGMLLLALAAVGVSVVIRLPTVRPADAAEPPGSSATHGRALERAAERAAEELEGHRVDGNRRPQRLG